MVALHGAGLLLVDMLNRKRARLAGSQLHLGGGGEERHPASACVERALYAGALGDLDAAKPIDLAKLAALLRDDGRALRR